MNTEDSLRRKVLRLWEEFFEAVDISKKDIERYNKGECDKIPRAKWLLARLKTLDNGMQILDEHLEKVFTDRLPKPPTRPHQKFPKRRTINLGGLGGKRPISNPSNSNNEGYRLVAGYGALQRGQSDHDQEGW